MASLSRPPQSHYLKKKSHAGRLSRLYPSPVALSFPFHLTPTGINRRLLHALRTGSEGSDLLRKPIVSAGGVSNADEQEEEEEEKEEEGWVDWEDQILEDTIPLMNFVRMILYSRKYENGDKLSLEHEKTIVERLLPYHPESQKKIGSGINYIMVQVRLIHCGGDPLHGLLGWVIDTHFSSLKKLIQTMSAEGATLQGSGWVWLGLDKELKKLVVETIANQTPSMLQAEAAKATA